MKKIATEIPDRFSVGNHDSVVWIERLVQTTFCWRFDLEGAVAKANFRLQSPSWHTRIWSRVAILDVVQGGVSPAAAYLLRDGTFFRPAGVALYCAISLLISILIFQWFRTSSPISRFYSLRHARDLMKACMLIAALSAVASFLLARLEEAPRSIPILHLTVLASDLLFYAVAAAGKPILSSPACAFHYPPRQHRRSLRQQTGMD